MRPAYPIIGLFALSILSANPLVRAQSGSASSRFQSIGTPSAVDQFRGPAPSMSSRQNSGASQVRLSSARQPSVRNETAYWQTDLNRQNDPTIRQTVLMQSELMAPPLGSSGMGLPGSPPNAGLPAAGSPAGPTLAPPNPNSIPQRPLPTPSISPGPSVVSPSDLAPIPQPQLDSNAFARVDNCNLVTPPSNYVSSMGCGCGPVVPTTYAAPSPVTMPAEIPSQATIAPVTVLPPVVEVPAAPAPPKSPAPRSLITFGQEKYPIQLGQGLWGQPVAYVPQQRFRNFLRYIFP